MGHSQWDESSIRVRPGKGSRPRTKRRPDYSSAQQAMVVSVDRGRWGCVLVDPDKKLPQSSGTITEAVLTDGLSSPESVRSLAVASGYHHVIAMRARELGRTPIVVGDRVSVVGDISGKVDTLARIVKLADRSTVLRRTADDTDPFERIVAGNSELLLIVVAVSDPPPRAGFVARALVAAYTGNVQPVLCLTKTDVEDGSEFAAEFAALDIPVLDVGFKSPLDELHRLVDGKLSTMIGHSGVGKSTLINRLIPTAARATGELSGVGKGKHTSTQSVALPLVKGGWVIDTPGIRSFGLAHIAPDDIVTCFTDLESLSEQCSRGCTHLGPPADPECAFDEENVPPSTFRRAQAVRGLITALQLNDSWQIDTGQS